MQTISWTVNIIHNICSTLVSCLLVQQLPLAKTVPVVVIVHTSCHIQCRQFVFFINTTVTIATTTNCSIHVKYEHNRSQHHHLLSRISTVIGQFCFKLNTKWDTTSYQQKGGNIMYIQGLVMCLCLHLWEDNVVAFFFCSGCITD